MLGLVPRCFRKRALSALGQVWLSKRTVSMARVRIKQGELQGKLETLTSGTQFASYKGIPFAKPPVGTLRFQAPLPPEGWTGVRDASEHGNMCPQVDLTTGVTIEGSEDCLFLNVYAPVVADNAPKIPVMVWFHGAGFMSGSGDSTIYGCEYLVEEGVVAVTVNYRLEALGFLGTETEDAPGNTGLKDQVAALRWVKDNISRFNGDPENVTIFGESAGGASTSYHMLSPLSKGLFHKVIAQSGCFLNEWALATGSKDRAFRVGKVLGNDTKDVKELLIFLRSVPAVDLTRITKKTLTTEELSQGLPIKFCPIIEKPFKDAFLSENPIELLKKGKFASVPVLTGYTNKEGMSLSKHVIKNADHITANFDVKIPRQIKAKVSNDELKNITAKVKQFYFEGKKIGEETISEIIDLESDYHFTIEVLNFAKILSQLSASPVFLYRFSVDEELNFIKISEGLSHKGACHADDIFYIFNAGMDLEEGSESWRAVKRMAKLWTNFAKYGNPTPTTDALIPVQWKPITKTSLNFLDIGSELKAGLDPDKKRFDFWADIYKSISGDGKTKSHL